MPHEQEIIERLQRIEVLLTGNGKPENGIIVRLDRQERAMAIIRKVVWALALSFIGCVPVATWVVITRVITPPAAQQAVDRK